VHGLPPQRDDRLLIGAEHFSDAGVYRIADNLAIVQTADFFPPLVDDPFTFGQIAAANALSDVYAMGAKPATALNLVGFPDGEADLDILHEILRGGAERVNTAGAVVVGGHSVRDNEIKFGLAVTGTVDPARMMTNAAAHPGDVLILTKGLGTGVITTANRAGRCDPDVLAAACESMVMLNAAVSEAAVAHGARCATDVTGFGLAGHALEMANASGVTIEIRLDRLPLLAGAIELATAENRSQASRTNREYVSEHMLVSGLPKERLMDLLFDPQTSGGLLIAAPHESADALIEACRSAGAALTTSVGRALQSSDRPLLIS
jgi:selenide,water dikinase